MDTEDDTDSDGTPKGVAAFAANYPPTVSKTDDFAPKSIRTSKKRRSKALHVKPDVKVQKVHSYSRGAANGF